MSRVTRSPTRRPHQRRAPHQRPDSRSRGATCRSQWRAGRHRAASKALELAQEYDLDLVEVAANARPPVCKLMDYGKFKYESAMKAREARKNQAHTVIKEMKLRPKIDPHDYDTKKGHVVRFLKQGDKVKITIMFRGREQSRPELGYRLLQRLAEDVTGPRVHRVEPEAGRPQHDHGPRPAQEEDRGDGREPARPRQRPQRRSARRVETAGSAPSRRAATAHEPTSTPSRPRRTRRSTTSQPGRRRLTPARTRPRNHTRSGPLRAAMQD